MAIGSSPHYLGMQVYERKKPLCTKTRNLKAQFIAKRSKLTLVSHAGILGNKCADAIAKISAKK